MWSGLGAALIGGALSAGGSLLGSSLSAEFAEDSAETAYQRQLALLKLQQDYATRMSNSAHQREIQDLRKAGLNPILSVTGGQGASTPLVSAPSVGQASAVDFGDVGLGRAADLVGRASAFSLAKKQAAELGKSAASQRALNAANASSAKAQAALQAEQLKTEKAKQYLYRSQAEDAQNTHLYKFPGLISKELVRFFESKFPTNRKSNMRFTVTPAGEYIDGRFVPSTNGIPSNL